MATSYLDKTGLAHLWEKIKSSDNTKVNIAQGSANANKYLATDENGNVITQELNCATTADIEEMCDALGLTAVVITTDDYATGG